MLSYGRLYTRQADGHTVGATVCVHTVQAAGRPVGRLEKAWIPSSTHHHLIVSYHPAMITFTRYSFSPPVPLSLLGLSK